MVQFFLNYVGVQDSLIAQIATKGCHVALEELKKAESFEDLEARQREWLHLLTAISVRVVYA